MTQGAGFGVLDPARQRRFDAVSGDAVIELPEVVVEGTVPPAAEETPRELLGRIVGGLGEAVGDAASDAYRGAREFVGRIPDARLGPDSLRAAGNALTLGFGDEISGVVGAPSAWLQSRGLIGDGDGANPLTLGESYEAVRDEARALDRELDPNESTAGTLATLPAAMAMGGVRLGTGLGARVGGAALEGLGMGALAGAGASEAESLPQLAGDVVRGGLGGAVAGPAVPLAGAAVGRAGRSAARLAPRLRQGADMARIKAAGLGSRAELRDAIRRRGGSERVAERIRQGARTPPREATLEQAGDMRGISRGLRSTDGAQRAAAQGLERTFPAYQAIREVMADVVVSPLGVVRRLSQQLADLPGLAVDEATSAQRSFLRAQIRAIEDRATSGDPITWSELDAMRRGLDSGAAPGFSRPEVPQAAAAMRRAAHAIREELDATIRRQDPSLYRRYTQLREDIEIGLLVTDASEEALVRQAANRQVPLTDYLAASAGAATGGAEAGVMAALGNRMVRRLEGPAAAMIQGGAARAAQGVGRAGIRADGALRGPVGGGAQRAASAGAGQAATRGAGRVAPLTTEEDAEVRALLEELSAEGPPASGPSEDMNDDEAAELDALFEELSP